MMTLHTFIHQGMASLSVLGLIGWLAQPAVGQTYLGGGYSNLISVKTSVYDAWGEAITLQREFALGNSRWQVNPTFHMGLLYADEAGGPFYNHTTTLSISPHVAYQLIRFKKIAFAPYVGPYLAWHNSLEEGFPYNSGDDLYLVTRGNRWVKGAEVGASISVAFTEQFSVKLTPLSVQLGNDGFRQGLYLLTFRIN